MITAAEVTWQPKADRTMRKLDSSVQSQVRRAVKGLSEAREGFRHARLYKMKQNGEDANVFALKASKKHRVLVTPVMGGWTVLEVASRGDKRFYGSE